MADRIYMDNAATSFPKPPRVFQAMTDYAHRLGASPGRGAYAEAREAGERLWECRQRINRLVGGTSPAHVVFTLNASDALNLAIRGLLRAGDHVVTTYMEHNSVLRPLNHLVDTLGIRQTRVKCDPVTGLVDPDDILRAIEPSTRLIATVHGSNVTGTVQPIRSIGNFARERDIPFLVDAAQTLGHVPLNVEEDIVDLLAFPGHKGLLGPLGTGALYIRPGIEKRMTTVREGGTGSVSELDVQPEFMPDRFEPGSHNALGLVGLSEGVQWLLDRGLNTIADHEHALIDIMLTGLSNIANVQLFGPPTAVHRTGVFSVRIPGVTPGVLSERLEREFGVLTRSGIHCAPLAHQTIGTHASGGTTRLSFGPFTEPWHVNHAVSAIAALAEELPKAE